MTLINVGGCLCPPPSPLPPPLTTTTRGGNGDLHVAHCATVSRMQAIVGRRMQLRMVFFRSDRPGVCVLQRFHEIAQRRNVGHYVSQREDLLLLCSVGWCACSRPQLCEDEEEYHGGDENHTTIGLGGRGGSIGGVQDDNDHA